MLRLTAIVAVLLLPAVAGAEDATSIELEGKTYGALPDEIGPIGGGAGYTKIVTQGDYAATNLDQLLEALSKAKPGQVVFIPGETDMQSKGGVSDAAYAGTLRASDNSTSKQTISVLKILFIIM